MPLASELLRTWRQHAPQVRLVLLHQHVQRRRRLGQHLRRRRRGPRLGQHLRRRRHGPLGQSGPGEDLFHALCLLLPKKLQQLLEGRWCCGRLWGTG
jgi:hypothetical protein